MKNQNLKTQKGITLVALVITIIVLLILAAVAIGAIQNKGIIKYAQNASEDYEAAEKEEQSVLDSLLGKIKERVPGNVGAGTKDEDSSEDGSENNGTGNDGDNTPVSKLGKYVKYDINGNGSVEDETIVWRVLRADADKVELITANAIGEVDLTPTDLATAKAKYENAVNLIVEECKEEIGLESNIRSVGVSLDGADIYQEDLNQMIKAGVSIADNSEKYCLASTYYFQTSNTDSYNNYFGVRYVNNSGTLMEQVMYRTGSLFSEPDSISDFSPAVRPILTLEAGILVNVSGIIKIYDEANITVSKLGRYVRYDVDGDGVINTDNKYEAILWKVLRDDSDKVELITADALGEVNFTPTDYADAVEKYNNAIDLIVAECKRVTGIESNIRSVGKSMDGTDIYEEDWKQMVKVEIEIADNSLAYWLASKFTGSYINMTYRGVRSSDNFGTSFPPGHYWYASLGATGGMAQVLSY